MKLYNIRGEYARAKLYHVGDFDTFDRTKIPVELLTLCGMPIRHFKLLSGRQKPKDKCHTCAGIEQRLCIMMELAT